MLVLYCVSQPETSRKRAAITGCVLVWNEIESVMYGCFVSL